MRNFGKIAVNFGLIILLLFFISCDGGGGDDGDTTNGGTTNTAPQAAFTYSTNGLTVNVNASSSSDTEDFVTELQVRWDWTNDGTWDTSWTLIKTGSHTYSSGGSYVVALQVRDTGGLTDSTSHSVNVTSVCPDSDGDGYEDDSCGGTDCDDSDASIHPGASECNPDGSGDGIDNDCDGTIDEGCVGGCTWDQSNWDECLWQ